MSSVGRGEAVQVGDAWVDALLLGVPLLVLFVGFAVVLWVEDRRRAVRQRRS